MALNGQASGDWTESSSNLRLLHVQVRNTQGNLTDDAFTQANPPITAVAGTVSAQLPATPDVGVLSGSVAFTRPDQGNNFLGGPDETDAIGSANAVRKVPLGLFINTAIGNAFENTPGPASGRGPYVMGGGTMGSLLYETQALFAAGAVAQGTTLVYTAGDRLGASRNGYLMPFLQGGGVVDLDQNAGATALFSESRQAGAANSASIIATLKNVPDATLDELVFDLRH